MDVLAHLPSLPPFLASSPMAAAFDPSTSLLALVPAPAGAEEPGLWAFFLESGPVAKVVLGVLVVFSLVSWALMLRKHLELRRARRESERFLTIFRKSARFSEVSSAAGNLDGSPLVGIFQAGYAEIDSQIKAANPERDGPPKSYRIKSLAALDRTLRRAISVEIDRLAGGTQFLATVAASSPFIGLFGTVWGIMVAFREIGLTGSTSIVTVAPGIAEALINTAAGLAAAIPALIGYNHFNSRLRRARSRMQDFVLELLNLAERNFT